MRLRALAAEARQMPHHNRAGDTERASHGERSSGLSLVDPLDPQANRGPLSGRDFDQISALRIEKPGEFRASA